MRIPLRSSAAHSPVHLVTALREYGSENALRKTTSSKEAVAARAKLVADVDVHAPLPGEAIRVRTAPRLTFIDLADLLPRCL